LRDDTLRWNGQHQAGNQLGGLTMLRTLFSVIAVIVLLFVGYLVYCSLSDRDKSQARQAVESLEPLRPAMPKWNDAPPAAPPQAQPQPPKIIVDTNPPPPAPPVVQVKDPPVAVPAPAPDAPRGKRTHIVKSGETLWSISKDYFGSAEYYTKIAEASNLREKDRIRVGQVLVIPNIPNVKRLETGSEDHEYKPMANVPEPAPSSEPDTDTDTEAMPPTLEMRVKK
jgi:LysM repeat protein